MYEIPDVHDAIGAAIQQRLMKPATWIPQGKDPVPVRVGFQAPYIAIDALGTQINAVQAYASGLVSVFAEAQAGDHLILAGRRWTLKGAPQPYGGGNLCRMQLSGGKEI